MAFERLVYQRHVNVFFVSYQSTIVRGKYTFVSYFSVLLYRDIFYIGIEQLPSYNNVSPHFYRTIFA